MGVRRLGCDCLDRHASFLTGLALYERRLDQGYSLTDRVSMTCMRRRRISHALTSDGHFPNESFSALLL